VIIFDQEDGLEKLELPLVALKISKIMPLPWKKALPIF
jgi:hypothetical protein